MFASQLYVFFGEMSVEVFFPLFDWVVCFPGIELCELLVYLEINPMSVVSFALQFSSVSQSCLTLCDPIKCSMPGFAVHQQFPELTQTHVHQVGDAIQPSHPLSPPTPPAFNLSQHQGLFKSVNSLHQVAKVLEFQIQHQSFK